MLFRICYRIFLSILLTILLISPGFILEAQNLTFEKITAEQGLSNNMVLCILQDSDGFIWFGTHNGLNRFDGYKIKIYRSVQGDTTSLIDEYVHSLYEDMDGILWAATINGLNRYDREYDRFKQYRISNIRMEEVRTNQVGAITEDAEGNIWFGNQWGGVYRFDKSTGQFGFYSSPSKAISSMYMDQLGELWIGTIDNELYKYNKINNEFRGYPNRLTTSEYIPESYIWSIFEDYKERLVIAASNGIYEFKKSDQKYIPLPLLPELISSFRNNEIHYVFEESKDIVWIGTWGKGLYRYNRNTGKSANFQVEPWNPNSLGNNDVNSIYKDRSGVIWIGTQDGLNILDPANNLFKRYQNNPADPNSLNFNFITSFCEDHNGAIWIGTYGGGINKFQPEKERFTHFQHNPNDPSSLNNNAIRAICEDRYGFLWIGTMKGLDRMDQEQNLFTQFIHDEENDNSLSGNDILCIVNGMDNDLWVGTYGDGLNKITLSGKGGNRPVFKRYMNDPGNPESLGSNYIRSLLVDINEILWIGTLGSGLDKMDPVNGNVIHYKNIPGDTSSLCNNYINCIKQDSKGYIWVGTWAGISRLDPNGGKFISYRVKDGLPDNNISEIQEDDNGNLWISTFKGLVRFNPGHEKGNMFIIYNMRNGLQGNKFNINASLKDKKGNLYFGGTTGFNLFDPKDLKINNYVPPVILTDLLIFNKPVEVGEKINRKILLKRSISETDEVTINYKDRIITIEFAALSYSQIDKNQYKYFLEGIDKEWVSVDSKRRYATYSNLPSGEYIFRVKASNSDGIWNEEGASLRIKVLPPPWKTWWAFIIYGFVIALFLVIARNYSVFRATLKHNLELEQIKREKSEELNQMKLKFFTNISHEFRTPLTLILGPLEKLLGQKTLPKAVLDHLDMMDKNARRLLHLINQLMNFRKIDTGNITLRASKGDIIALIREIKAAFDEFANEHKINYQFISDKDKLDIWYDKNMLEMVIYNLLSNAFKFTSEKGKVIISVKLNGNIKSKNILKKVKAKSSGRHENLKGDLQYVIISVEDAGIGIPKERVSKIFDRFHQVSDSHAFRQTLVQTGTGIGLSITKEIVELHKGKITVESEVGQGTVFRVYLPVGCEHLLESEKIQYPESEISTAASIDSVLLSDDPESEYIRREKRLAEEQREWELKILLVEDNRDIRKFILGCMEENYLILESENGAEGYEMAINSVPDLIISDVLMPVMDGHEFCRKIKTDIRTSHIPVILLTAYNTLENNIKGYETGADDYISKPFNARLLNARIRNLVETRKKLKEIFSKEIFINPKRITLNTLDEKFIEKAIDIVETNMADPEFSVVTLGRELGMSRTNLFRKMKALTDHSASEFIRSIRIKKAAQLLLSGYNVSQVMYEVGISSRSYFNKCFYEQFKMTPSEYIRENIS